MISFFSEKFYQFTKHIFFWWRFIDDVLIFWEGDVQTFQDFVQALNINEIGMHFTSEIQEKEICFLDLKISVDPSGCIHTDIYCKPTSTNSFLRWESHHPEPLKHGIPIGQYIRAKRNCPTTEFFETECANLYQRFQQRGYPKKWLRKAYWRAKLTDKTYLLKKAMDTDRQKKLYVALVHMMATQRKSRSS